MIISVFIHCYLHCLLFIYFHQQVRKSFLETLGIKENPEASKLILEEFVDGRNAGQLYTEEDQKRLDEIKKNILNHFGVDEKKPLSIVSGQSCSDMIIQVGEF